MTDPKYPIRLYNTLSRTKEEFSPLDPENVRMYVCGPTVYDFAHIGNARPVIVFDVLFRLLRHVYGPDQVTYVRNITDVDDKINARAAKEHAGLPLNQAIRKVTEKTEAQYLADMRALGNLDPSAQPRATAHIEQMKTMIETLVAKGNAYIAQDHVLFDVASMPEYGQLSNRNLDEMEAGARVEIESYKRGDMDFVLWKPSRENEPGWPSPAGIEGVGRPGWHIECSAMAKELLGDVFDIHGGGVDLAFPHHENELAQSRCANGSSKMAQIWMHNGYLMVENEKMSKSLGNFITANTLLETWPGEVIRLAMLMTHYTKPIDFTEKRLEESFEMLQRWARALSAATQHDAEPAGDVLGALADDLNTPLAVAGLQKASKGEATHLKASLSLMGFEADSITNLFAVNDQMAELEDLITAQIAARHAARAEKDWAEADRIRKALEEMGIVLKDAKDPETGAIVTTWEVSR